MNTVTINGQTFVSYKNKNYPIKTLNILIDNEPNEVNISVQSLADAMTTKLMETEWSTESIIDSEIYFYVDDNTIDQPDAVLAANLDEVYQLALVDSQGEVINIGDDVEVPIPNDSDLHNFDFVGRVDSFRNGTNVVVEDGDGDFFEIEAHRVTLAE